MFLHQNPVCISRLSHVWNAPVILFDVAIPQVYFLLADQPNEHPLYTVVYVVCYHRSVFRHCRATLREFLRQVLNLAKFW